MKITKFGHCCLLIEEGNLRILTDPGNFTNEQNSLTNIHVVLITHEHADHFHTESVKEIVKNNPNIRIITNSAVGKKLDEIEIKHEVIEGRDSGMVGEISIEAFDGKHEEIFKDLGQVQNTGYFINNTLFYPGDSFHDPEREVDILALPVAGPWCKIGDAIRYCLKVKPKRAFPVHDAMIKLESVGSTYKWLEMLFPPEDIEFISLKSGDSHDFN